MRLKTLLLFVAFLTSTMDFAISHQAGQQAPGNATVGQSVSEGTNVTSAPPQGTSSQQPASQNASHGGFASPVAPTAQPVSQYPNHTTQQSSPGPTSTTAPPSSPNTTSTTATNSSPNPTSITTTKSLPNPTSTTTPQSSSNPTTIQNPTTTEKGIQIPTTRKTTTPTRKTHVSSNFGSGFAGKKRIAFS